MATESPLQILSSLGIRGGGGGAGAGAGAGGGGDALTNAVVGLEMSNNDNGESLAKELEMLLRERNLHEAASERELELELSLYRSGSAPPRVQGSVATVGGLFPNRGNTAGAAADGNYGSSSGISEEELRSHPAYLDYYYRHVNLNPRLPHPLVSREDWKLAQRLKANNGPAFDGGIGDLRGSAGFGESNSHRSLFSTQPGLGGLPTHKEEDHEGFHGGDKLVRQGSAEWLEGSNDGLIGLSAGGGLGSRRKSFADVIQEELGMPGTNIELFSRPSSRAAHNSDIDQLTPDVLGQLRKSSLSSYSDNETLSSATSGLIRAQSLGNQSLQSFAAAVGSSLSRNPTPEPQHIKGSGSLCGPTVGRANPEIISGFSSDSSDLAASFAALKVSPEGFSHARIQADNDRDSFKQSAKSLKSSILKENQVGSGFGETRGFTDVGMTRNSSKEQLRNLQQTPSASSIFSAQSVNAAGISNGDSSSGQYINQHVSNSVSSSISGYPVNPMLLNPMMAGYGAPGGFGPLYDNNIAASAAAIAAGGVDSRSILNNLTSGSTPDISHMYRLNGQIPGSGLQMPAMDALGLTQLQKTAEFASRAYMGNNYFDGFDIHRAYIAAFLAQQHSQYGMPYLGKSDNMNSRYLETPSYGFTMPFSVSPIGSQGLTGSPMTHVTSSIRNNERNSRYSSSSKVSGGIWNAESILDADIRHGSSLLDEFKTNKTRCFELSDITGHVSEFSADQVGSRFIQQKLETASTEEKNMIFREIFPEALHLMTDVFGNYVLQKFFEHGTPVQRRELANLLSGHVLEFSLQMYGCRVIQKAVEVVDMDQKINLVQELDGNVMRCVRDQNGNHVIQKCIECIPQDKIYFIISSFFGQVVTLSMHPYGCRVIQRVLEHCKDEKIQSMMMEEILQSVCALAQDQYGNYVVQHVLEHGKQHERAAVVKKLAGQIVQMSQQKFASNVIEKCLQFGGLAERQVLINEMLGSSDENEPLQAMMKDQFANYVVQKVFETCDDDQCELILSRIKVHLNSLKKYTYGKHIVARVEKLLAAGEKRNGTRPNFNL